MSTTHTTQERSTDNRQASFHFPSGAFEHRTHWLVVVAYAVGCVVVFAGVLLSAGLAAAYLAALIPGPVGVVVFFTVGLGFIGAAPEIARWVCNGVLDALESYRGA